MPIPKKVSERLIAGLKRYQPILESAKQRDVGETDTVTIIKDMLADVFKRFGKRIFRMAPIHHHFEHLGWSEPTVVIRFWIISFILALAGLSTLKLR